MARRYRARRARKYELLNYNYCKAVASKSHKYQYVTHNESGTTLNYLTVVPAGSYAGVRKVKNFVISIIINSSTYPNDIIGRWCLCYLPQRSGTNNESLTDIQSGIGADMTQIYEPNQHIIATGVVSSMSPTRVRTSLARNLMNGDKIILFVNYAPINELAVDADCTVNVAINVQYALCYN